MYYQIHTLRCSFLSWEALGNEGWSYDDVLPYFLKSENASLRYANYEYHNTHGYLNVQDSFQSPIMEAFINGSIELGNRFVDYNSPDQVGFAPAQATVRNGRRYSAGRAFLSTINDRDNLHILTSARVTKIIIDNDTMTAQGVEYIHDGVTYTAYASKEVVISAGNRYSYQTN